MAGLPIDLQESETVLLRVRRHLVFLMTRLIAVIIVGVIPVVALLALAATGEMILTALALLWGLLALLVAYFIWYRYQHNEWIITNQRLIDSEKKHWFDQQIVSTDLIHIEDMTVVKSGFLQTIFNYGDLRCETAGHSARFLLRGIPDPAAVLDKVDEARDAARRSLANAATLVQAT